MLIEIIGNGWAPQSYASTSIGTTGRNYDHNLLDPNNLSFIESHTSLKRNQEDDYAGPAVVNDSHVFCNLNHELSVKNTDSLSVKNIDLNDIKSRSAIQPQGGDELLQVPNYNIDNFEYVTNMTNTCKDVHNQPCHDYLTEYSRSMGHLGPTCNSYQSNMITQEVSIISQKVNDGFTVNAFLAFIHPNPISQFQGFYTVLTNQVPNLWCPCPEPIIGPIRVSYTFKICHNSFSHGQIKKISSEDLADAKQTYQNLLLDQKCQKLHKCSYEYYITKIIDELTEVNHMEQVTQERCQKDDKVNVNGDLYAANIY